MVEVSTDKVDAEVPAPAAGTIDKILAQPDETVNVGAVLAEMTSGPGGGGGGALRAKRRAETTAEAPAAAPADGWRRQSNPCGAPDRSRRGRRPGQGPGNRRGRQGDQGRRARRQRRRRRRAGCPARHRRGRGGRSAGPGGDARQGDERVALDPDRDLVPDARRRHARRQAQGAQRRAQGARDEGLVHPPDRLGDRPRRHRVADDGARLHREGRQAGRDRAGRGRPRHRRRRRAQGRAQPAGPGDQGGRPARLRRFSLLLRGADHQDAREQAHRRRLPGRQHHADQPGRSRHDRLGAAADGRPGHDHRRRLARLSGRVGPHARREDQGARGLEGDDDDLDLRPPDHPGRRVGIVPAAGSKSCCRARTTSTRTSPAASASTRPR